MQKWEYGILYWRVQVRSLRSPKIDATWRRQSLSEREASDIEPYMNKLGEDGWELVSFESDERDSNLDVVAVFKRPKS